MRSAAPCDCCSEERLVDKIVDYVTRAVDPATGEEREVVVRGLPVRECSRCGARILGPDAVDRVDAERDRAFHLLSPDEIRALRTRLGLTQAEFARLLGLGAKTLTRWETGHLAPSRAMNGYLRLVDDCARNARRFEAVVRSVFAPGLPDSAEPMIRKAVAAVAAGSEAPAVPGSVGAASGRGFRRP